MRSTRSWQVASISNGSSKPAAGALWPGIITGRLVGRPVARVGSGVTMSANLHGVSVRIKRNKALVLAALDGLDHALQRLLGVL